MICWLLQHQWSIWSLGRDLGDYPAIKRHSKDSHKNTCRKTKRGKGDTDRLQTVLQSINLIKKTVTEI